MYALNSDILRYSGDQTTLALRRFARTNESHKSDGIESKRNDGFMQLVHRAHFCNDDPIPSLFLCVDPTVSNPDISKTDNPDLATHPIDNANHENDHEPMYYQLQRSSVGSVEHSEEKRTD